MFPGGSRGSSKRVQVALILFCVALHTSSAFLSFIFGPRKKLAVVPIDDVCMSMALVGNCSFYQCFNQRHPCNDSDNNYALNYGWRFCTRFDTHRSRLTDEGQRWLKATRNCSMIKMLEHYREGAISCSAVESDMRDKHADCEATHGLCRGSLIADNKEALYDVYTLSVLNLESPRRPSEGHLRSDLRTKRVPTDSVSRPTSLNSGSQFLYSLEKCAVAQVSEAVTWLRARLAEFQGTGETVVRAVLPIAGDISGHVRNLEANVGREFGGLGSSLLNLGRLLFGRRESDD